MWHLSGPPAGMRRSGEFQSAAGNSYIGALLPQGGRTIPFEKMTHGSADNGRAPVAGSPVRLDIRRPVSSQGAPVLSVIVPLAEAENEPEMLLGQMPPQFEIILARGGTRASSMNHAARFATGRHLWFVHADTILTPSAIDQLLARLAGGDALHYFDLKFDRGALMRINELGVRFRSRVLGIPFGDQALCLPAATFRALGGYDEATSRGEDHLLVRRARRAGLRLRPVCATVVTSARKYREGGWLRTTCRHLRLTLQQARVMR